jgi:uncharacterized protein with WD repeat
MQNELIRGFAANIDEKFENFKWSDDSKYLARLKKDILIIYVAPTIEMLADSQGVKQPIKDGIKELHWFPGRNVILTISEKKAGKKVSESILQFFEIPSRKAYPASALSGLEIMSLEWHKNNTVLAVVCKTTGGNPKFSVRIYDFDYNKQSYRSFHSNLTESTSFFTANLKWMGNDIFLAPKYKENSLDTMNVYPYKFDRKTLKLTLWANDKFLKALKHSDFLPSPDGVHFLLACLDPNNSNSYGKCDLYALFDGSINYCRTFEFTNNTESIRWDPDGRLFMVQMNRRNAEGCKFYDTEGNLIYDLKDPGIVNSYWRPRHHPMLDKIEEDEIRKNMKNLSKVYEEEDSEFLSAIEKLRRAEKKKAKELFMGYVDKRRQLWEERREEREKLYKEPEEVIVEIEYVREEILHTVEELVRSLD